ncbi:MAG: AbrB/MazE/SpoVT family DNA-binding domain-containing protein [Nitrososphaerota archaeon]|nr:AbrB/MazE/SpoVT family DNA-binding domain-containing protein [Nitrososphaerota archaeon]
MPKPVGRIGKKYAVYLPKQVVKAAGLEEGDRVEFEVVGSTVEIQLVHNPLALAISGSKFASMKPGEIEELSLSEQAGHARSSP